MLEDREKLNRIEDMKSRLFGRSYKTEIEHRNIIRHTEPKSVPDSWRKDEEQSFIKEFSTRTSLFKKFFIFSVVFFILALAYASYNFFAGGNTVSTDNIEISVLGNTFTAGGEELPLQIDIANKNNTPLDLVDLVVEYPKSSATGLSENTERLRQSLGTIPAGAVRSENVKVTLFGKQGSMRPIKISLEYRVEGSNAIFVKDKLFNININSTPVNLSIDAPAEISPNQDVVLEVKATLNANKVLPSMLLRLDYPAGFQFALAKPAPSFGNNVWNLGDLAPSVEHSISITGKMIDVFDGEEKTFRAWTGTQSPSDKSAIEVIFNSIDHTLAIKKAFIEAKLFINGVYQREYATNTITPIQGEIRWTNNLDTKINDLEIKAKISGNAVDRRTINSREGFYDSLADSVIWDKNYINDFASVNPGDSGSVRFSISSLSLFSAIGGMLSEPTMNIEISIAGKQAIEGNILKTLSNGETKIVRIISDVGFANKILYYSGAFQNTGTIPPKAEKETTYTVVWTLSNTANSISNTKIKSTLPPWVRFVGVISPASENLDYNASTKEIVWNVGAIPRGAGITTKEKEVAFQVAFIPSLSQIGNAPTLINDAILTGHDDFANVNVRINKSSLNTNLTNDPLFPSGGDRVTE
ncbi:hypothetical protein A3A01_01655 [Candidatus Nomurabacteria bacterium RIFCSPLOWO2_01_FULL_39_17]|uniref:DUF11 domain-containing protein n=1 Tax=Candidatus Nomurabacteria bacterium RIFCSPLOWO2_01_FULL_39_17 TaxID=1801770 RepID=A0A1F6WW62_9BACT|nr:MAG: hypothetical protein A3A01_01655 [Candidatus Nomurabacteria bacterium RIFCSPLOWO2_01_FULL_39_17]